MRKILLKKSKKPESVCLTGYRNKIGTFVDTKEKNC